jgi:hypothetical protein
MEREPTDGKDSDSRRQNELEQDATLNSAGLSADKGFWVASVVLVVSILFFLPFILPLCSLGP